MFSCCPLSAQPGEAPSSRISFHFHAVEVILPALSPTLMSPIASPARSQILHPEIMSTTIGAFLFPSDASVARRWIHSSSYDPPQMPMAP